MQIFHKCGKLKFLVTNKDWRMKHKKEHKEKAHKGMEHEHHEHASKAHHAKKPAHKKHHARGK